VAHVKTVATCSLEIVIDKGVEDDWFSSRFIVTFAVISLVSFLLLVPWELTREDPIVDLGLFARRQFATCAALMFAAGAILFSSTQLLPQLAQTTFQYTATLSGLVLLPGGVATAAAMILLPPWWKPPGSGGPVRFRRDGDAHRRQLHSASAYRRHCAATFSVGANRNSRRVAIVRTGRPFPRAG
jgi:hypothetical protein